MSFSPDETANLPPRTCPSSSNHVRHRLPLRLGAVAAHRRRHDLQRSSDGAKRAARQRGRRHGKGRRWLENPTTISNAESANGRKQKRRPNAPLKRRKPGRKNLGNPSHPRKAMAKTRYHPLPSDRTLVPSSKDRAPSSKADPTSRQLQPQPMTRSAMPRSACC